MTVAKEAFGRVNVREFGSCGYSLDPTAPTNVQCLDAFDGVGHSTMLLLIRELLGGDANVLCLPRGRGGLSKSFQTRPFCYLNST